MQTLTVSAAKQRLGISNSTFSRHIKRLGIQPQPDPEDAKGRRITVQEFERIKKARVKE